MMAGFSQLRYACPGYGEPDLPDEANAESGEVSRECLTLFSPLLLL
jgi:hypothetical protein